MTGPARPPRPRILVLAGVNGSGKSSVAGAMLADAGLAWFNPDSYARLLVERLGIGIDEANGRAWEYGRSRLAAAVAGKHSHAFETTLGGNTLTAMLAEAARTHDVWMIFCGLASAEQHIGRVKARVAVGGHDIPAGKILERWNTSRANLVKLLPLLGRLQVFDNSAEAAPGADIADPVLVMEMSAGQLTSPRRDDLAALQQTPVWARAIVQAAIELQPPGKTSR